MYMCVCVMGREKAVRTNVEAGFQNKSFFLIMGLNLNKKTEIPCFRKTFNLLVFSISF